MEEQMEASDDMVEAIDGLAHAILVGLSQLGNGNASSPMGAFEAHGAAMLEAAENIASAIRELSSSIDALQEDD
jgi:hypothetical protein